MATSSFDVLNRVFANVPELSLLWNWGTMSDQDKQLLVRAMELFVSPVYDTNTSLWNPMLKLSLYSQFYNYYMWNSQRSTISLAILISNCIASASMDVQLFDNLYALRHDNYTQFRVLGGFDQDLIAWFDDPTTPKYYLCSLSMEDISGVTPMKSMAHNITVMFLKEQQEIKFRLVNSYDETVYDMSQEAQFLENMIRTLLPNAVSVTYLPFTCPLLQENLGPNCAMWSALTVLHLAVHPEHFDNPEPFLQSMSYSSAAVIILFQLYFLCFQMSFERFFISNIVYEFSNMSPNEYLPFQNDRLSVDNDIRDASEAIFAVTNCHNMPSISCSAPDCQVCGTQCVNNSVIVSNAPGACVTLTLVEVVDELVRLQHHFVNNQTLPFHHAFTPQNLFYYLSPNEFIRELAMGTLIRGKMLPISDVLDLKDNMTREGAVF